MKIAWIIFSLVPTAFLFHFIETSLGSSLAFFVTAFCIIVVGVLSIQVKKRWVFLMGILSIMLSRYLAPVYIVAPNESWFNPFSMEGAVVFTGVVLVFLIIVVRTLGKSYLNNRAAS